MAIYRQIHTTIWQDNFVGDVLTEPPEKLFWAYLLTNSQTTQCGVYPFRMRQAQFDTGLTEDEIKSIINKLVQYEKIKYSTENNEIMIVNWLKYNSARSPKVAAVIDKELLSIKTLEFESEVIKKCLELKYPIKTKVSEKNTVSIPYRYPIDTILQPEPEPTQNQNITNTATATEPTDEDQASAAPDVYAYYQEAFGVLNSFVSENLTQWVEDLGSDLVIEAMKRSALDQKGFRYAEGIMRKWAKKNLKTLEDVAADDVSFNNNSRPKRNAGKQEPTPPWAKPDYVAPVEEKTPEQEAEEQAQLQAAMEKIKQGRKEEAL
ncbi:DnaD domain protein [Latilactobacillus curvatus]|uniref:DnaD domain-containing protein n=1 Tax=Latilactobacillus curvatus TaxID=28038 RepID=UPI0011BBF994|nr:DnaD domain protein [Latilactobacillus curvatus]QEA48375.1 DnaD domain protein [Latilactobacillus curvatus]